MNANEKQTPCNTNCPNRTIHPTKRTEACNCNSQGIPQIGAIVRPAGSDILYRVVAAGEFGCHVEATQDVQTIPGRTPRKLHYAERRFSLAYCRNTGTLFDDTWRAWQVVDR